MGLRARQLDERKRRILDVADALIRETGGTDFTMRTLASMSDVSPATPYNLFGSKEGLLSAALSRALRSILAELLDAQRPDVPLEFLIRANEVAVSRIVANQDLMRPLYLYLLGMADTKHRPHHVKSSLYFWRTVAETAGGSSLELAQCDALSYMLFAHFRGLLELWIHRDVSDEGFIARALYGSLLIMASFVPADQKPALDERLEAARAAFNQTLRQKAPQVDGPSWPF